LHKLIANEYCQPESRFHSGRRGLVELLIAISLPGLREPGKGQGKWQGIKRKQEAAAVPELNPGSCKNVATGEISDKIVTWQ
jgi:hypothetical protein